MARCSTISKQVSDQTINALCCLPSVGVRRGDRVGRARPRSVRADLTRNLKLDTFADQLQRRADLGRTQPIAPVFSSSPCRRAICARTIVDFSREPCSRKCSSVARSWTAGTTDRVGRCGSPRKTGRMFKAGCGCAHRRISAPSDTTKLLLLAEPQIIARPGTRTGRNATPSA